MELGFVLVVCVSAAAGLALRTAVNPTLGRALLAVGLGSLVLALGSFGVMVFSQGRLIGVWTAAQATVLFLGAAALVLPFALAASWRRP